MRFITAILFAFLLGLHTAFAHEFWLEPQEYQVDIGEQIVADLRNGEEFSGGSHGYIERYFERFEAFAGDSMWPVAGRTGDRPALQMTGEQDGLHVFAHVTTLNTLTYKEWAKFQKFADHKDLDHEDFPDIKALHDARGLPETGFKEGYTRFVKSLVGVGSAAGSDVKTDMEIEFVALDNPYTANLSNGFRVQLFYRDEARKDAQVEIFEKAPGGTVNVTLTRTDDAGIATIPVTPAHSYLLDAVVLRAPESALADEKSIVWETLWAALTFGVPD